jgi:hypothetical protein
MTKTILEQAVGDRGDKLCLILTEAHYYSYLPTKLYQLFYCQIIDFTVTTNMPIFKAIYTELFKESDTDAAIVAFHERLNCGNPVQDSDARGIHTRRGVHDVCVKDPAVSRTHYKESYHG